MISVSRLRSAFVRLPALSFILGLAFGLSGLRAEEAPPAPRVVVSIAPIHSLASQVMAGVGTPRLLLRSAASAHRASLRPSDARALAEADLVVWVGPLLEAPLQKSIRALTDRAQVLELARSPAVRLLPLRQGGVWAHDGEHNHGHDHGHDRGSEGRQEDGNGADNDAHGPAERGMDAHIWLDPDNARAVVDGIAAALAEADPSRAAVYTDNASRAHAGIAALDDEIAHRVAGVKDVPFVVFHDAYQYFERHYGLSSVGAVSLGADRGTGARRLIDLRARLRETKAACVFSEPQFEPRLVQTLIEGTNIRTGVLDPLGASLEPGPTLYPALMRGLAHSLMACLSGP